MALIAVDGNEYRWLELRVHSDRLGVVLELDGRHENTMYKIPHSHQILLAGKASAILVSFLKTIIKIGFISRLPFPEKAFGGYRYKVRYVRNFSEIKECSRRDSNHGPLA